MKVACLANINNMMFILCRYLRDEGHEVELITLSDEPEHFQPGADAYDSDFEDYYTVLPITKSRLYKPKSIELVREKLTDFDFLIGTDIAPTLASLAGRTLDVFIPHGSDIYDLPFTGKRNKGTNKVWWLWEKETLSKIQRIGIEETTTILFPDEYDIHFPFKHKLNTKATYHNTSGPMVYIPQYYELDKNPLAKNLEHYAFFKKLKTENDLVIFSHSRHNGFNLPDKLAIHQKGNNILIKGFADFVNSQKELKVKLVFFEYGMNVEASKLLVQEYGIEDNVIWMPLMPRREIMFGLNMADISCGQFDNSWLTCGVVNETLASDKPLLHFRNDELYTND